MLKKMLKYSDRGSVRLLALAGVSMLAVFMHSCRNPPAFTVTGRTEVERFMMENEDIGELFDLDVYASDTFALDSGSSTFRTAMVTEKEKGVLGFSNEDTITNSFGTAPIVIATRRDRYGGKMSQRNSLAGDEVEIAYDARLIRKAMFMKLGSNDDRFFGWEFIGIDIGKPMWAISELVTVTQIPVRTSFPITLSDQMREGDLPARYASFTYFFRIKQIDAGDSIDIKTKRGAMTIFARTSTGHRQLNGFHVSGEPSGVLHYGYRTPPADFQNQFYHLITFQQGPEIAIDSTIYNLFVSAINEVPLDPPDTVFTNIVVEDTIIDSLFIFRDTCTNTIIDSTAALDSCILRDFEKLDTMINFSIIPDTALITTAFDTIYDSVLAPDTSLRDEDLWVFPYSVR